MIGRLFSKRVPVSLRKFSTPGSIVLKIDGKEISVPRGTMLVDAIKMAGSNVPTVCYHPDLKSSGGICRVCLVESSTAPGRPIISCRTPVAEGMDIITQGPKIKEYRQSNLAMMLSEHPNTCIDCPANPKCKTQSNASILNSGQCGFDKLGRAKNTGVIDDTTPIRRDEDRCINCDICINACKMQDIHALAFYNEGGHKVRSMGNFDHSECIQCGQCINRCPTGALTEKSEIRGVLDAISDPKKVVVIQMAPSIRVAIAEEFGFQPGEKILRNEIATALRKLGPNVIPLDTNFSADLTIIEEGNELIERLYRNVTGKKLLGGDDMPIDLPMFTSCCPGWVTFMEKNYPEFLNNLSTCRSPQGMMGGLIKGYWAKNVKKIDPKNIVSVSIMPCTAKKVERARSNLVDDNGDPIIDYVLTTRELAKMLKQSNIDPGKLPPTPFEKVMSEGSGAAVIFGATGGVMEAALRTAYEVITGREVPFKDLNIEPVRGMEGIREAAIKLENVLDKYKAFEGVTIKVAIGHGPENAHKIMEVVKQAKSAGKPAPWHFIEIMACPGGCIGGGGQPKPTNLEIRKARTNLIYKEDMELPIRKSHDNSEINALYKAYLKEPLGHNSHHYLHTSYIPNKVRDMATYNVDETAGLDSILDKYPKDRQYLVPIIVEESDKKGYISDPSIVKIANHLGLHPAEIDSIISSYHYFPRRHTSDAHIYMCTCHNCMMKGQGKIIKAIKEKYGINNIHGGASKDGRFSLHTLNWLGYCVNDGPAMMIKRTGTNYVETFIGLTKNNIQDRIDTICTMRSEIPKFPKNNIVEMSMRRNSNIYSFMESSVPLNEAVKHASQIGPEKVIEEIYNSALIGRGGAGFRTGLKWKQVYKETCPEKYVVCNADEGLPSTFKDWCILNHDIKRKEVLTGMGICANAIGAHKCFIYLRYEYRNLMGALQEAIKETQAICPGLAHLQYEIRLGAGPYVAGEENAQFESIEGKAPLPRKNRPANVYPTMQGLFYKPTVINNVETFASVPHIIHQGSEIFGPSKLPKLLSVTGDVERPSLIETSLNNYTLNYLVDELKAKDIVGAEVGGSTEEILFREKFDSIFGFGQGTINAVGSVVLFNSQCDFGEIYENKLKFMAEESCKQCVPCRDGSKLLWEAFHQLRCEGDTKLNINALKTAAESAGRTSICGHGKALEHLFNCALDYVKSKKRHKL